MSTIIWRGDAQPVAQTSSVTITAYDAATTYKITINSKTVSVLGTGGSVSTTAVALLAALVASPIPEFAEVAWTNPSGGIITGTAGTPGMPFTFTKSVSGGTGTMGSITTVSGSGPNDVAVAANWTGGVLPTTGDSVYFQGNASPALWNLDTFSGVVFALLDVEPSYTGTIGLSLFHNFNLSGGYLEYRPSYFQNAATVVNCDASGSGRVKIDNGSAQTTATFLGSGTPIETNTPAILWKGTHASNVVSVNSGDIGVAFFIGETATVATFNAGLQSSSPTDPSIVMSTGVTLTTVNKSGGTMVTQSNITTLNHWSGTHTILAGAITTLTLNGGIVYANGSGTITTATVGGGTLDFRQGSKSITLTNTSVNPAVAKIFGTTPRVTYTNPPKNLITNQDLGPNMG